MPDNIFALIDRLVAIFPECFNRQAPKPLKIGIGPELLALVGNHPELSDISRKQIRQALAFYTGANAYRKAVAAGGPRYGLDGQPDGEVTPDQQEFAKTPRKKKASTATAASDPVAVSTTDMTALLREVMAMAISAKLDVTIKINQLPQSKPASPKTVLFAVQANNRTVVIELKNKTWNTLKEAAERYPQWVAAITGQPGEALPDGGFRLDNPAVQVFEKKPKPEAEAPPTAPTTPTIAALPTENKPKAEVETRPVAPMASTPPASTASSALPPLDSLPSSPMKRPKLSLKNRGS